MEKEYSREQIKAHILYKLARHRRWGAKHTELANVKSALPPQIVSEAEGIAKELANEGPITWLKKTNQIHISLNPQRKKEIVALVGKYFGQQIW